MDSRNVSIFSQSFFVPGKRKESKLSLTCKPKNQLKRPAENPLSKQEASSNKLENGHTSGDFSRTNSTEMEKFLEKFKNPSKPGRVSSNRNLKGIGTALHKEDGGMSKISSSETEESDFKEPYLPSSDFSKESVSAKESKRIMPLSETKSSDSVANFSEENRKCVEKSNDRDDVRSEPSEPNILLCPLCWRPFDCKDAQFTHMKACAAKHNVSTKQLLELLELIQKQEEERKVLGLPLLPSTIARKVKKESIVSSIKPKGALDGNIQLGIALSVSLKEAELQKERDYLLEAGLFDEVKEKGLLPDQEVKNHPLPTAPIFLSVGRKDCNTGIGLPKRRKYNKLGQEGRVPTLLKRTTEDREKLITEKVAIILVGDEELNASLSLDDKENLPTWKVKSNMLRKYLDEEQIWWKMAGMQPSSSSKDQFYVSCLSNFISPCKVVVGSKLKHLSQIPGRDFSPEKVPSIKLPDCEISREVGINLSVSSSKDLRLDYNVNIEKKDAKRSLFAESPLYTEQNTLPCDWIMLVGNSEMSDVTIYTHGERKIPAHKLVFFARCPAILKDLVEEEMRGQKSSMLLWVDTCHAAAFVFLKYIYAGIFNETEAKSKKVLENLNSLAERYEVKGLLAVLEQVCCSKEEEENSIYASNGKVNKTVNFGGKTSPSFVDDDEDGFYRTKNGIDLIMKDSDVSLDEQGKKSSVYTSTTDTKEERCSYVDDESHAPSRSLEESYSCQRVHAGINIHDDDTMTNSPCVSPNVSDLGRNSPDIFQVSKMMNSPASVEILEDKPENSEEFVISEKSFQESRESIEYLVSLMEKDSSLTKSTEDDPQESDNVGSPDSKENLQEQMSINSHISESPSFVKTNRTCSDLTDPIPPETPLLQKEVEELVISSTPVVQVLKAFGKCGNFTTKDETMTVSEVKRKLTSLDKSNPASPNPKKICIEADKDNKVMESGEREVVDLTLSGSNSGDVAENITSNVSVCSTIPPPGMDLDTLTPSKDVVTPSSPAASPCGAYISNIWDDFDYVPDIHRVDFDGSICASQKSFIEKENEEMCNTNNSNSIEKDVPNELIAITSSKVDDDVILIDEEEAEKSMFSAVKSVKGSPEKEVDITEKLLNASFNKVDDSIFWRDENEPKEEIEKSNSSVPCQTPVRCFNPAGLKKDTPKTPVFLKKANVTPLADYSAMKTPMLHKELDRYGIKHLRKNQAKQLLRHIYNELHPLVSDESSGKSSKDATSRAKEKAPVTREKGSSDNKVINKKKITFESLDSSSEELSSSEESSDGNSDFMVMEESIYEPQLESPVKSQTLSQKGACVDIPTAMRKLIESDSAFHRKILLYEPIWLNEIKAALKANGAKFNLKQLMDYLDEQCITFRIAQGNRHQRRRRTKKVFSLSQPSSQKRNNKEPISCSQPS